MKKYLNYSIAAVALLAVVTLIAWNFDLEFIKRPLPGSLPMNPVTALCFLFASLSFLALIKKNASPFIYRTGLLLGIAVLAIGLIKLLTLCGVNTGIDYWLFKEKIMKEALNGSNVLMAPSAGFSFTIIGLVLLFLRSKQKGLYVIAEIGSLIVLIIGIFSIVGYVNQVKVYYSIWNYIPLAPQSTDCFILLAIALLFENRDSVFAQVISSPNSGGKTARRLIPAVIIFPVLFCYIGFFFSWKFPFTIEFGATVLITSIILVLITIVWISAWALNLADARRLEAEQWQYQYLRELERINAELQKSEERYQKMVAEVQDYSILLLSKEGNIENWNKGAEKLKGYKAGEILGKNFSVFYPVESLEKGVPEVLVQQALETGRSADEGWLVKKDGTPFWASVTITSLYDDKNNVIGFSKVTRDLTLRKSAEDQLQRQADLFKLMPDAVIYGKRDLSVTSMNLAAEQMFEVTTETARGWSIDKLADIEILEFTREEIETELWGDKGYWRGAAFLTLPSGKKVNILLTLKATVSEAGRPDGLMGIFTDITVLRINEELTKALKKLEDSNNYLEQLAYVSAHDLKSPILTVAGLTEELIQSKEAKNEHSELIAMIHQTVEQMKRTNFALSEILKLRKNLVMPKEPDSGEFMPLREIVNDVKAVLQNSLTDAAGKLEVRLNGQGEIKFPYYHTKSILYNLVHNSIKYADPARRLSVLLKAEKPASGGIQLMVEDNGLGMDMQEHGAKMFRIFKRFHNHVEGTGVGLHIVKSIVDAYGGTVEVQSAVGKGTCFTINFNNTIIASWN